MTLPVIIIGGGGHARVLIDTLLLRSIPILGFTDADPQRREKTMQGIKYIGDDSMVSDYAPTEVLLVNGLGSTGLTKHRRQLYEIFKSRQYSFLSVLHPSAIISADSIIAEGVQIMAGAVIQAGCHIGENTIINTKASIDHECSIGSHVHIAPGATLSGHVQVEDNVHIGTAATVIQQIRIQHDSLVGAGSVVIRDIPSHSTVYGVPAKEVKA